MDKHIMTDFPKLECPFVRHDFKVNEEDFLARGSQLFLRSPSARLVIDKINPGYEWVFEDKETFAVEKLNGTNVKVCIKNGRLIGLQNRKNIIDPLQVIKGKTFIIEGIFRAIGKGYLNKDGEQAGEIIGPNVQGNPYKLDNHLWYPFEKAVKDLKYRSFDEHDRTYDNWSTWFQSWLHSRFYTKRTKMGVKDNVFAEGIIFYNFKRKAEEKSWRAKLRRDMFPWFYEDGGVRVINYQKEG